MMHNPTLQGLLNKGYEVLLLDDPIDEYCFQHLTEFKKSKLVNVGKGDFKFPEDDETEKAKLKALNKMYKTLLDWWKDLLSVDLENVKISQRLVEDPCVVVSPEHGFSANMERIAKAQAYAQNEKTNPYANAKKILEINPHHPSIKELFERVKEDPEDQDTKELARVLYEGAAINSGYLLREPAEFKKRFYALFNGALGIPKDAKVEEVEVELESTEDEPAQEVQDNNQTETIDLNEEIKPEEQVEEQAEPVRNDDLWELLLLKDSFF